MNIVENGEVAVTVLVSQLSCIMVMGKLELFVHVVPAHGGDHHMSSVLLASFLEHWSLSQSF